MPIEGNDGDYMLVKGEKGILYCPYKPLQEIKTWDNQKGSVMQPCTTHCSQFNIAEDKEGQTVAYLRCGSGNSFPISLKNSEKNRKKQKKCKFRGWNLKWQKGRCSFWKTP